MRNLSVHLFVLPWVQLFTQQISSEGGYIPQSAQPRNGQSGPSDRGMDMANGSQEHIRLQGERRQRALGPGGEEPRASERSRGARRGQGSPGEGSRGFGRLGWLGALPRGQWVEQAP